MLATKTRSFLSSAMASIPKTMEAVQIDRQGKLGLSNVMSGPMQRLQAASMSSSCGTTCQCPTSRRTRS
jgi:hypothetical protein